MKSIVITGVSTGIGYGACKEFIKNGYQVFGSVRKQEDADRLKNEFGELFIPLMFDITDHKAIYEAVNVVKASIKDNGLAGLINSAGAAEGAPLMYMPIEVFQKHLDVLVTGHLVVTQAFLPLLGAQGDCAFKPGRIINISSVSGKLASPFMGGYVAAKHALEGLSACLRIELQVYGIDVIVVGPGFVQSEIWNKVTDEIVEKYNKTDYYDYYKNVLNYFRKLLPTDSIELDVFSSRLRRIFEVKRPKTRYAIVKKKFIYWMLPRSLSDRMTGKLYAGMMKMKTRKNS